MVGRFWAWVAIIRPSVSALSPVLLIHWLVLSSSTSASHILLGYLPCNSFFPLPHFYLFGLLCFLLHSPRKYSNWFICCPVETWCLKFSSESVSFRSAVGAGQHQCSLFLKYVSSRKVHAPTIQTPVKSHWCSPHGPRSFVLYRRNTDEQHCCYNMYNLLQNADFNATV